MQGVGGPENEKHTVKCTARNKNNLGYIPSEAIMTVFIGLISAEEPSIVETTTIIVYNYNTKQLLDLH